LSISFCIAELHSCGVNLWSAFAPAFHSAPGTGLRLGEALSLEWDQVKLEPAQGANSAISRSRPEKPRAGNPAMFRSASEVSPCSKIKGPRRRDTYSIGPT